VIGGRVDDVGESVAGVDVVATGSQGATVWGGVVDDLGGVAGENDAGGVRSWLVGGRVRQAFGSGAATPCQGSVGVASCYLLRSVALFARWVNGYTMT
jgi:hypothetical protein